MPASLWEAPVGADDTMPWEANVDGRKNAPDETRRGGVDVAVGADESSWDRPHPADDAIGTRLQAGRVPRNRTGQLVPATIHDGAQISSLIDTTPDGGARDTPRNSR